MRRAAFVTCLNDVRCTRFTANRKNRIASAVQSSAAKAGFFRRVIPLWLVARGIGLLGHEQKKTRDCFLELRAVVTAPRSPKASLDLVPRGNKRFRRGEQQESFVTLMTGFFGRMGNSESSLSLSLSRYRTKTRAPFHRNEISSCAVSAEYRCN